MGSGLRAWLAIAGAAIAAAPLTWACGGESPPCRFGDRAGCKSACDDGSDPASCTRLGAMLEHGTGIDDEEDPDEVPVRRYLRGCLLGDGEGCQMAGFKFLLGKGVDQDTTRATRAFDAACTLDYGDGCAMLGLLRNDGETLALYEKGCTWGALGCRLLGESYTNSGDTTAARKYLSIGCQKHDAESCELLKSIEASAAAASASASWAPPLDSTDASAPTTTPASSDSASMSPPASASAASPAPSTSSSAAPTAPSSSASTSPPPP
jgi:hypothetical protein